MSPAKRRWLESIALQPELRARIFERFPRLYQHPDLHDFDLPAGWFELLWRLSTQLEPFELRACQVKTKFGGLRFDYEPHHPKAEQFITTARAESETLCEACGKRGMRGMLGTWVVVTCEEHEC